MDAHLELSQENTVHDRWRFSYWLIKIWLGTNHKRSHKTNPSYIQSFIKSACFPCWKRILSFTFADTLKIYKLTNSYSHFPICLGLHFPSSKPESKKKDSWRKFWHPDIHLSYPKAEALLAWFSICKSEIGIFLRKLEQISLAPGVTIIKCPSIYQSGKT